MAGVGFLEILQGVGGVGTFGFALMLILMPWVRKRLVADTTSIESTSQEKATKTALESMQAALDHAERQAERLLENLSSAEKKIDDLKVQVETNRKEYIREMERERGLHNARVIQLLEEIHRRDETIESLRRGGEGGTAHYARTFEPS